MEYKGHLGRTAGQNYSSLFFLPVEFFLVRRISRFWRLVLWHLWIGRPRHSGPKQLALEKFDVGGWLAHGDLALDSATDFLAV